MAVTGKGEERRRLITAGAAQLLREGGPAAVSHRAVARHVGCSVSATTYYFDGRDDLLAAAARHNIARWAARAERVAEDAELRPPARSRREMIQSIVAAMLPTDEPPLGHYLQLVAVGGAPPASRAYRTGRDRLNLAMTRLVRRMGLAWPPELVIAVVDGAAVDAISEGREVRSGVEHALDLLFDASGADPERREAAPASTGRRP